MGKIQIKQLKARKIINSAGVYSIEVSLTTSKGKFSASVPEGTSKGKHEVKRYVGGINNAVKAINTKLSKKIKNIKSLQSILVLEKTTSQYGGCVCLAISYVLLKGLAAEKGIPVWKLFKPKKKQTPKLLSKMLGGGLHAGKRAPSFQEYLILGDSKNVSKNIQHNLRIHNKIKRAYSPPGKDLEGGWVLRISDHEGFKILKNFAGKSKIGADFAASGLYDKKTMTYGYKKGKKLSRDKQIDLIVKLQKEFNLYYIEDPLQEEDFEGFAILMKKIGKKSLIVGDDLLTTDPERLKKAIKLCACNGCIVKPDQIGSLTQTINFVKLAKKNKLVPVISHRSGETNDNILSDLAVGLEIPIMKIGIVGGERISKLNRLMSISEE